MRLTDFQRQVLRKARTDFLYGAAEVRAARTLQKLGLLQLWDDGAGYTRRSDGERWSATLTQAGLDLLLVWQDDEAPAERSQQEKEPSA